MFARLICFNILTATARSRSFCAAALGASNLRFSLHVLQKPRDQTITPERQRGWLPPLSSSGSFLTRHLLTLSFSRFVVARFQKRKLRVHVMRRPQASRTGPEVSFKATRGPLPSPTRSRKRSTSRGTRTVLSDAVNRRPAKPHNLTNQ